MVWSRFIPQNRTTYCLTPRAPSRRATSFFRNRNTFYLISVLPLVDFALLRLLHCSVYCYCIFRFPVSLSFQSLDRLPNIYERPSTTVMFISAEGSVVPSSSSVSSFPHHPSPAQGLRRLGFFCCYCIVPSSSAIFNLSEQAILTLRKRNSTVPVPRVAPILTQDRPSCFAKRLCRRSMYSQLLQSIVRRLSCRFRRTDTDDATRASDSTRLDSMLLGPSKFIQLRSSFPARRALWLQSARFPSSIATITILPC